MRFFSGDVIDADSVDIRDWEDVDAIDIELMAICSVASSSAGSK